MLAGALVSAGLIGALAMRPGAKDGAEAMGACLVAAASGEWERCGTSSAAEEPSQRAEAQSERQMAGLGDTESMWEMIAANNERVEAEKAEARAAALALLDDRVGSPELVDKSQKGRACISNGTQYLCVDPAFAHLLEDVAPGASVLLAAATQAANTEDADEPSFDREKYLREMRDAYTSYCQWRHRADCSEEAETLDETALYSAVERITGFAPLTADQLAATDRLAPVMNDALYASDYAATTEITDRGENPLELSPEAYHRYHERWLFELLPEELADQGDPYLDALAADLVEAREGLPSEPTVYDIVPAYVRALTNNGFFVGETNVFGRDFNTARPLDGIVAAPPLLRSVAVDFFGSAEEQALPPLVYRFAHSNTRADRVGWAGNPNALYVARTENPEPSHARLERDIVVAHEWGHRVLDFAVPDLELDLPSTWNNELIAHAFAIEFLMQSPDYGDAHVAWHVTQVLSEAGSRWFRDPAFRVADYDLVYGHVLAASAEATRLSPLDSSDDWAPLFDGANLMPFFNVSAKDFQAKVDAGDDFGDLTIPLTIARRIVEQGKDAARRFARGERPVQRGQPLGSEQEPVRDPIDSVVEWVRPGVYP